MARVCTVIVEDPDARRLIEEVMAQHGAERQHIIHYPANIQISYRLRPGTDVDMLEHDLDRQCSQAYRGAVTGCD